MENNQIEDVKKMKALLLRIAYPSRGSTDEYMDIQQAANLIQAQFSIAQLSDEEDLL